MPAEKLDVRFAKPLLGLLVVVPVSTACSSEAELGSSTSYSEAALTSAIDCGRETEPAYSGGQQIGSVDVVRIGDKRVAMKTAHAFLFLQKKADAEGINISINSGFRTMSEQQYFYDCYKSKSCNNGNLAARPGYSNHQNGRALDIGGDRAQLNTLIDRLGLDWRRTVSSEPWHYEYFGPEVDGPCGAASTATVEPTVPVTTNEPDAPETPEIAPPTTVPPPLLPPSTTPPPSPDPSVDPYDPVNPYDPYRNPQNPQNPYGTPDPYGAPNPYGTPATPPPGSEPGSIPTLPGGGNPVGTTPGAPPATPGATPPAATPPPVVSPPAPTPVLAAPEAEAAYTPTPKPKKSSKAKPQIESGCAAAPVGSASNGSSATALFGIALSAVFLRRRRR